MQKITIFNAPMTIKAKKKSLDYGLLSLTCIQFERRFEYLRKTTDFWVYATTYKGLSCYIMKQKYLAFQKNYFNRSLSSSLFLFHSIVYEGKVPDNGGVPVRGFNKEREPKRQMRLIKMEQYFHVIKYLIITVICQTNLMK